MCVCALGGQGGFYEGLKLCSHCDMYCKVPPLLNTQLGSETETSKTQNALNRSIQRKKLVVIWTMRGL